MHQNYKIGIGVLAAVVVIGGGYLLLRDTVAPQSPETSTGSAASAVDADTVREQLASFDEPTRCTIENADGSEGSVYLKDEVIRVETVVAGTPTYILLTPDSLYFWQEGSEQGFSLTNADVEETGLGSLILRMEQAYLEELQKPEADCAPAEVSDDLMAPPGSVEFGSLPF